MKDFTRYEQMKAAFEHKEADCLPFDLGATEVKKGLMLMPYKVEKIYRP